MKYIANVKTEYTQEQIDDVLCAAFEGGISHWASAIDVKDEDYKGASYGHEVLTRGGRVFVIDDDGKKHELKLQKVVNAMAQMQFNVDDYDALDADCVVQTALFGEVVYG